MDFDGLIDSVCECVCEQYPVFIVCLLVCFECSDFVTSC